jgi:hypothetical protein
LNPVELGFALYLQASIHSFFNILGDGKVEDPHLYLSICSVESPKGVKKKSHSKNEKMHILTIKILQHLAFEQLMMMISCFLAVPVPVPVPQERELRNMHEEEEREVKHEA